MLAQGLRARGHVVHTFPSTVDPARAMYSVHPHERGSPEDVTRVVNNLPGRGARKAGQDTQIDRVFERVRAAFRPDVIHIQHLCGLSTSLPRAGVPTVWTLHDAWGWCAAGGTLLRGGEACAGPGGACAACASAWMRDTPSVDRALGVAAALGSLVRTDRLHRAWQALPRRMRGHLSRGVAAPLLTVQVDARAHAFREFAAGCLVVSPSQFLSRLAAENGIACAQVLPHGVTAAAAPGPAARMLGADAPLVFLGTLARHKGPHLVRAAWELAGRPAPLRMHGPPGPDPAFHVLNDGPLAHSAVGPLLSGARALVMGSIWPENAPLVVLEARASGCPVIAPDVGGISEIVEDGVDGWLYPPGDVPALAERLLRRMPAPVRPPPNFETHLDGVLDVYQRARSNPVTPRSVGGPPVAARAGLE